MSTQDKDILSARNIHGVDASTASWIGLNNPDQLSASAYYEEYCEYAARARISAAPRAAVTGYLIELGYIPLGRPEAAWIYCPRTES